MADKIIGLRINVVGTDDIVKRISTLNTELEQTKQEAAGLQKALRNAVSSKNAEDAAKYGQQLAEARAKQNDLKLESAALNKELKLQQKAFKAAAADGVDSYSALDAQLSILRDRYKQLSAAERNSDIGKQLTTQIDKLNGELVESDAKLGVFSRNVGNYSDSVVKALRRAGNEEALTKGISQLNEETDQLRGRFKMLYDAVSKGDKSVNTANSVKELGQIEKQIKANEAAVKDLNKQLSDTKGLESKKGISGRDIGKIGKAGGKGAGAAAGVVGGLFQGAEAAAQFGPVGIAAFGIFAAGGLAFKAIDALSELSKQFQKLESDTARFSGASGLALKGLAVDVKATADTFGKDQDEILKTTKALSKSLNVDFATALTMVQKGLLTGADASGDFLATLEGSAEAARLAGLSIDDLIVFSNEAVESGILSERGIELVNTFGSAIKSNSSEAKAALSDALGSEFTDGLFKGVQDGSISTKDAISQVSTELQKQGVSAKDASAVFVEAFGAQTTAENDFILGLNKTGASVDAYIDKSNNLTRTQAETLKANKALASAQQGLATTFEGFGFSFSNTMTTIQAGLTNFANKALIAFDTVFGSGLAAGREALRATSQALKEQNEVVANLETNIAPLITRYDELSALLPTLAVGSIEAEQAQAELAKVITAIGGAIPSTITQFGKYNEALNINSEAAKAYIQTQKNIKNNVEGAQNRTATAQLSRIEAESQRLQGVLDKQEKAATFGAGGVAISVLSPIQGALKGIDALSGKKIKINDTEVIATNAELQKLGKELAEVEGILKSTESGRNQLALKIAIETTGSIDPREIAAAQARIVSELNKEATDLATKGERDKSAALKKQGDADAVKRNADAAKKGAAANKSAADKRKAELDKLLEEEKGTRQQLLSAKTESDKAITSLSVQNIEERGAREAEALKISFSDRIESETKALSEASDKRVELLGKLAKSAASDKAIRAQFGTPEQIGEQAVAVAAETQAQIQMQTSLIMKERDKQLKELEKSRLRAVSEAIKSIDTNALQNAISEVQGRLDLTQGEGDKIQLRLDIAQEDIEFAAKRATAALGLARAGNLISEAGYQKELKKIEADAANARIQILIDNYDAQAAVVFQKAELQKVQIEGNLAQAEQAIRDSRDASIDKLDADLEAQLISTATYDNALIELNASTNEQLLLADQKAAQDTAAIDAGASKERLDLEREITSAQIDYLAERTAAYKENQMAILKQFAEAVAGVGGFILDAAKTADDFYTASENNKKAAIQERYAAELTAAQGNAAATAEIEARKAKELERIERAAAARRKAIAIGQAIVNGAVAVTNILATTPDPTGIFTTFRIAGAIATTAAQVALISSQTLAEGGSIPAGSGFITGRSHAQGGVRGAINGRQVEVEGGEYKTNDEFGNAIIINKHNSNRFRNTLRQFGGRTFAGKRQMLSDINSYRGLGVRFAQGGAIPPQSIGTGLGGSTQGNTGALLQLVIETQNLAIATNERIDRLIVVADAQSIVNEGLKDTPRRNTQIL